MLVYTWNNKGSLSSLDRRCGVLDGPVTVLSLFADQCHVGILCPAMHAANGSCSCLVVETRAPKSSFRRRRGRRGENTSWEGRALCCAPTLPGLKPSQAFRALPVWASTPLPPPPSALDRCPPPKPAPPRLYYHYQTIVLITLSSFPGDRSKGAAQGLSFVFAPKQENHTPDARAIHHCPLLWGFSLLSSLPFIPSAVFHKRSSGAFPNRHIVS